MPEVLGDTGLTFGPTDIRAGAKAVLKLLKEPEMARSLAQAAHERSREFTWERTGRLTREAYRAAGEVLGIERQAAPTQGMLRAGGE